MKKQLLKTFFLVSLLLFGSFMVNQKKEVEVINANVENEKLEVYLLDGSKQLIPLQMDVAGGLNILEKVNFIFNQMSSEKVINGLKGFIPLDCLNLVDIKNKIMTIDFNENLLLYDPKLELKILEALAFSFCQFEDIKQVKILFDGQPIEKMPLANTPIPNILDKKIGINNFELKTSRIYNSRPLIIYNLKEEFLRFYFVPKTYRIDNDILLKDKIALIMENISNQVTVLDVKVSDNCLDLKLSNEILNDEGSIDENILYCLSLSLFDMEDFTSIRINVDDNYLNLTKDGLNLTKNDLIYNNF